MQAGAIVGCFIEEMCMEEYEYSFNVDSVKPFINYCENHGYKKLSKEHQNRVVYQNHHIPNVIARITKTKDGSKCRTVFDCKKIEQSDKDLKVSKESMEISVTSGNKASILSMLETLGFYVAADNTRTRYVYEKDSVRFEIDEYVSPQMNVVAIEGQKGAVDKVYAMVRNL